MNFLFKVAHAADTGASAVVNTIVPKIVANIISPLVQLLFALATVIFIWGLIGFFMGSENAEARKTGVNHILWGIIGMAIMVSVYGIIRFVASTVGVDAPL